MSVVFSPVGASFSRMSLSEHALLLLILRDSNHSYYKNVHDKIKKKVTIKDVSIPEKARIELDFSSKLLKIYGY